MSLNIKKFSIVTVCKNSKDLLEETILSVINQTIFKKKLATLEYIIIDGNSTDASDNLILDLKKKYPQISYYIENDKSLFDGLSKGLKKCTGDYVAYINAGDFYNKTCFEIVDNVFNSNTDVHWITGNKIVYNNKSEIIDIFIPYQYRSRLIQAGVYGKYLPFIQQESVFWKIDLNKEINFDQLKKLKRCGDLFIWKCFSKKFQLYNVNSYLSGFKYHENQLSFRETGTTSEYINEFLFLANKLNILDIFFIIKDSFFWLFLKYQSFFFLNNNVLITFNKFDNNWNKVKKKINILYCWLCDSRDKDGESKLSLKFCSEISTYYDLVIIISPFDKIVIKNKLIVSRVLKTKIVNLNFYHKYITPFIGILFVWYIYLFKRKKVAYINFLPLWNSLIFLLLPKKTILGPITGYAYKGKIFSSETFVRKKIFPTLMFISIKIINLKFNNIYFSTINLIKYSKNLSCNFKNNYSSAFIDINKNNLESEKDKKIDFAIYYRRYDTKNPEILKLLIEYLVLKGLKVVTYGDVFETKISNIDQKGFVDENFVNNLLNQSKFTILSQENLFSLSFYHAINSKVKILYDNNLSNDLTEMYKQKIFFEIDFSDLSKTKELIDQIISEEYFLCNDMFIKLSKELMSSA